MAADKRGREKQARDEENSARKRRTAEALDRVAVDAGSSTSVTLSIDLAALGTVDVGVLGDGGWVLPRGSYRVAIDGSSKTVDVAETVSLG